MTAKEFFKSTSFKCIVTLLSILLVCGIFLTVMYGLLEVTDEERLSRAINKIYGRDVNNGEDLLKDSNEKPTYGSAEIQQAYKITFDDSEEVNYLVQATGKGGYGGGTVTCWVAVVISDDGENIGGIGKVSIASNSGQSFISKITGSYLDSFSTGFEKDYGELGFTTEAGYLTSGASMSSNAINNAVNGAVDFVDQVVLGHTKIDKYEGFEYTEYINTKATNHEVADGKVTYTIKTQPKGESGAFTIKIVVNSEKKVETFEVQTNGSTGGWGDRMFDVSNYVDKDVEYFKSGLKLSDTGSDTIDKDVINAGATHSSFLCVYAGAFATANYDKCIAQGGNS